MLRTQTHQSARDVSADAVLGNASVLNILQCHTRHLSLMNNFAQLSLGVIIPSCSAWTIDALALNMIPYRNGLE